MQQGKDLDNLRKGRRTEAIVPGTLTSNHLRSEQQQPLLRLRLQQLVHNYCTTVRTQWAVGSDNGTAQHCGATVCA
jgi:hypothetical protein